MVKNVLFVLTHVGSDWERLAQALETNPRLHVFSTGQEYHHPDQVKELTRRIHRRSNSAAIWVDVLFNNKDLSLHLVREQYRFVCWDSGWNSCRDWMRRSGTSESVAERYYACRISAMKEYHRLCPRSLWNPNLEADSFLDAIL